MRHPSGTCWSADGPVAVMRAFADRFGVDLSAFRPELYFGPEAGWSPIAGALLLPYEIYLEVRHGRDRWPMLPITLGDLARAAERGRWADPRTAAG